MKKMSLALSKFVVTLRFVTARGSSFLRSTIVLLTVSAWLLASNRCAMSGDIDHHASAAGHAGATAAGHAHHPSPSQDRDGDESDTQCCSSLQATAAQPAKGLVAFDHFSFAPVVYFLVPLVLPEAQASAISTQWDTGPPYSFAENVLQRCLPSNAPPSLS
jgi:hypothetical protein